MSHDTTPINLERPPTVMPLDLVGEKGKHDKGFIFALVFYLLVESMKSRQNTVLNQSKTLEMNSDTQDALNKADAEIKFEQLPPNASRSEIAAVQAANQQAAAAREDVESGLIVTRQQGQVLMTKASTTVDVLQQYASEDSAWIKTENVIVKGIIQMTQR